MNWYEQHTDEFQSLTGKQLLKAGGASWYGAFIILKQIIAQNMNEDMTEWGFVPKEEKITSLAEKCGLPEAQFRLFLAFCDDRFILEKRDSRLFCPSLLEEKNRYAKIIERRKTSKSIGVHSAHTDTQEPQKDVTVHNSTAHTQHNTEQRIISAKPSAEVLESGVFGLQVSKGSPVSHEFQDAALRMATSLGIQKPSSSWFGFFKKNYGLHRGMIDSVYASMADVGEIAEPEKYFFKVYSKKMEGT